MIFLKQVDQACFVKYIRIIYQKAIMQHREENFFSHGHVWLITLRKLITNIMKFFNSIYVFKIYFYFITKTFKRHFLKKDRNNNLRVSGLWYKATQETKKQYRILGKTKRS